MQDILGNSVVPCGRCHCLSTVRPSGGQIFKADGHFMGTFISSPCPAVFPWQYFVAWIVCLYSSDWHYFSPPSLPKSTAPKLSRLESMPCHDLPWSSTEIPRAMCGSSSSCGPHWVHWNTPILWPRNTVEAQPQLMQSHKPWLQRWIQSLNSHKHQYSGSLEEGPLCK